MENIPENLTSPELHIEISRTDLLGIDLPNIEKFKDCYVWDEVGQKSSIADICRDGKTILIFLRHFLCYTCEEYVEDLSLVTPESLKEAGVKLVLIGCAPWRFIKNFRSRLKCPHPIFCDENRKIYEILKLVRERYLGNPKESKHVKSGYISGLLKTTWRAWESMEWQGDPYQQGGAMVVDSDGRIVFSHKDTHATDHCSINSLLTAVNMEPVSFPRDPQIRII